MLQRFLEDYGEVDVTVNGAESVDFFVLALDESKPYDIVFLDIMMPEMDGLAALGKIRNKEKAMGIAYDNGVIIVMTSSLDTPEDVLDTYYKGLNRCDDYLTKPIDLEELTVLLQKYGFSSE
jgi:two-component system chemotaxis response regulator CheY